MGVNGTSIVADATENIRNNVRVQTMSEIFDTEGYVVWMISDGKLRSLVTLRRFSTILRRQLESFSIFSRSSLFSASDKMETIRQKRGSGCCGEQCNDQHSDKCDRIAAQCEIQSEKRIGKEEIDTDYGENRRKEHVQVSVRISCNQDLDNNIK